jgi:hypothetical protein
VGEVDEAGAGIEGHDRALHLRDIGIAPTEIGEERDNRLRRGRSGDNFGIGGRLAADHGKKDGDAASRPRKRRVAILISGTYFPPVTKSKDESVAPSKVARHRPGAGVAKATL